MNREQIEAIKKRKHAINNRKSSANSGSFKHTKQSRNNNVEKFIQKMNHLNCAEVSRNQTPSASIKIGHYAKLFDSAALKKCTDSEVMENDPYSNANPHLKKLNANCSNKEFFDKSMSSLKNLCLGAVNDKNSPFYQSNFDCNKKMPEMFITPNRAATDKLVLSSSSAGRAENSQHHVSIPEFKENMVDLFSTPKNKFAFSSSSTGNIQSSRKSITKQSLHSQNRAKCKSSNTIFDHPQSSRILSSDSKRAKFCLSPSLRDELTGNIKALPAENSLNCLFSSIQFDENNCLSGMSRPRDSSSRNNSLLLSSSSSSAGRRRSTSRDLFSSRHANHAAPSNYAIKAVDRSPLNCSSELMMPRRSLGLLRKNYGMHRMKMEGGGDNPFVHYKEAEEEEKKEKRLIKYSKSNRHYEERHLRHQQENEFDEIKPEMEEPNKVEEEEPIHIANKRMGFVRSLRPLWDTPKELRATRDGSKWQRYLRDNLHCLSETPNRCLELEESDDDWAPLG